MIAAGMCMAAVASALAAQAPDSIASRALRTTPSLALGVRVGDQPLVAGVRLNYRDDALQAVYGANLTVWQPRHDSIGGNVYGGPSDFR